MLRFPSVHPFLMTLLTEIPSAKNEPAIISHDSWQTIVEDAITQRIAPLLLRWLSHPAHRHNIPLHLLTVLKQQVLQYAAWNLLLTTELRSVLATCAQRGIPCIPIRGPALAEQLYGDCATRPTDDLDLLVPREDLSTITDIFQQRGYALHEHRSGFLETFSYSLEFVHPNHGFLVEPHWTLAYPPFVDITAMQPVWARARKQQWAEIDTWSLSHEDLLLHLCLHLHHKGRQAPLLWCYELDAVIRRHGATFNWNIFMEQAHVMDQARSVADVLTISMRTFHSPVPDSVVGQLLKPSRSIASLPSSVLRHQLLAQSSLNGRDEFALLCSIQGLRNKIRYVLALLFPSPQYMTRRYGASTRMSLTGFYFSRFFHLGAKGLRCAVAWVGILVATRASSSIRE